MKCPYCGSERIVFGVGWGKSAEAGNVGLKYNTGGFLGAIGVVKYILIFVQIVNPFYEHISKKILIKIGVTIQVALAASKMVDFIFTPVLHQKL